MPPINRKLRFDTAPHNFAQNRKAAVARQSPFRRFELSASHDRKTAF
jgi:hypothetical protein